MHKGTRAYTQEGLTSKIILNLIFYLFFFKRLTVAPGSRALGFTPGYLQYNYSRKKIAFSSELGSYFNTSLILWMNYQILKLKALA